MMLRDKADHGGSGRGTGKVSGNGLVVESGGCKAGSGGGKGVSCADKGRRGGSEIFDMRHHVADVANHKVLCCQC